MPEVEAENLVQADAGRRSIHLRGAGVDYLTPKDVKVRDREDIGDVIQWGKNLGTTPAIRCAVIYFPETGECRFYAVDQLTRVD